MLRLFVLALVAVSLSPVHLAPSDFCATVKCAAPKCTNPIKPAGQCCERCPKKKPGKCPKIEKGKFGICLEACSADEDCTGNKKCCSNGCGNTCQTPECTNGQNGICNGIQGLSCTTGTTCMFTPKGVADGAGKCCYDNSTCTLPIEPGGVGNVSCEAYIPSYGFNPKSCNCEKFIYSGCGGNENRFGSFEDCRTLCQNVAGCNTIAVCGLQADPGPCEAKVQRYYYNNETCQCEAFTWGGCDGNQNNFLSFEECSSVCNGFNICEP